MKPDLSAQPDLILFLIGEELKSCRLARGLERAGFDYSPFHPHLDSAIMAALGLTDERDETYAFYFRVMEEHAERIDQHSDTIAREALNVYRILAGRAKW